MAFSIHQGHQLHEGTFLQPLHPSSSLVSTYVLLEGGGTKVRSWWKSHMSAPLLLHTGNLKVLVGHSHMSPELLQSLIRDVVDPELLLALGEPKPKFSPSGVTSSLAEELGHGGAAVSGGEGRLVGVVRRRAARRGCCVGHLGRVRSGRLGLITGQVGSDQVSR